MSVPVQLELSGMQTRVDGAAYPRVDRMRVPFTWEPLEYVMGLYSPDFERVGLPQDWDWKRGDPYYQDLVDDIERVGVLDPVFLFAPHTMVGRDNEAEAIGNGHHRVAALYDLGYKYVPVTRDIWERWRRSGIQAQ